MPKINVTRVTRVFMLGDQRIPDPNPDVTPEEAVLMLAVTYPSVTNGVLESPAYQGSEAVYKIAVKTGVKG